jgi:hypothetical protein
MLLLQVDSTGSSGYSSETDAEEEANIIYYEVFLIHRAYLYLCKVTKRCNV